MATSDLTQMQHPTCRALALSLATTSALIAPVQAAEHILSAPQIAEALQSGEMVLLDIRSEAEWRETGLAEGAWPVSMHTADFSRQLQAVFGRYAPGQVAIICATGGRTGHVAKILKKNGIDGVIDVSEGMIGNHRGPGWLARKMPTVSLDEARRAMDEAFPGL